MKTLEAAHLRIGIAENIVELTGGTPMLHLARLTSPGAGEVYAKLEYLNPGGSVKDRAAVGMIRRAEQQGLLRPGSTIIEATAVNTGIGLAILGVNKGYRVVLFVPERFSREKVQVMEALGAEVHRTPDSEGIQGAIRRAKELAAGIPDSLLRCNFRIPPTLIFITKLPAQGYSDRCRGGGMGW